MIIQDEPADVWRCTGPWGVEIHAPATIQWNAERATTPHGDVYFRRPDSKFDTASEKATELCRRLKAIKRNEQVSTAYWVTDRLAWRRLTIYHESAKTVRDTLRAVLGLRGRDYAEDKSNRESGERSSGLHAHLVIVPPHQVEALRKAFARPSRTVPIREDVASAKVQLDLGDTVGGIPLWAVKDMLRGREWFSAETVAFELGLSVERGRAVFDGLVQLGFLERDDRGGYQRSTKGRSLVQARFTRRLARDKAATLLTALIERAEKINANPDLAFTVAELRLYGSLLTETTGDVGDIDVAFSLRDRPGIGSRVGASMARWRATGRVGGSYFQHLIYGEMEVLRLLRGRSPYLSLQPMGAIETLGCSTRRIFVSNKVAPASTTYTDRSERLGQE